MLAPEEMRQSLIVDCNATGPRANQGGKAGSKAHAERPNPNRYVKRGLTFESLFLARGLQSSILNLADTSAMHVTDKSDEYPRIPFWVVNTTAGVGGSFDLFEAGALPDFEDSVFEFAPTGYGSGLFGYWPGSHPDVDISEAVSASAAFFDSQQRAYPQPWRFFAGIGLRVFQLNWGLDISNPAVPDRVRGRKSFLPFPLYYLYAHENGPTGAYIHLSDGGQSDNTGVFSLVRRGVGTIVFVDAGQDQEGRFSDLCTLRRQLLRKGLYLSVPTNRAFDSECSRATGDSQGPKPTVDLWSDAFSPVFDAYISRHESAQGCSRSSAPGDYCAHLIVVKPAIPWNILKPFVQQCDGSLEGNDPADSLDTAECRRAFAEASSRLPGLPAELFGFLVRNWTETKDGHPIFPQHSTVKMTYDSSAWLFGGYRELGRWHASRLHLGCGTKSGPVAADRVELRTQRSQDCRAAEVFIAPSLAENAH
jgi:hypothetical protein